MCRLCTVRLEPDAVVDAMVLVEEAGCPKISLDEVGTNWDTARANSSAKCSVKLAVVGCVGSCEGREVRAKKLDTCEATSAAKLSMLAGVISPMGVGVA